MSRELLARTWAAGAGPGDAPFTIDLDSTICETYGMTKERARRHGYTGKPGCHPLLAVAAGTGDVLMARLREGRANTARGAAHFLRETVGRCATAGPGDNSRCGLTAASMPTPSSPSAARWMSASPSPSASTKACTMSSRRYPRRTGRRFLTGWTALPMSPRPPTEPVSEVFIWTNIVIRTAFICGTLLMSDIILSSSSPIIRMPLDPWTSETSSTPRSRPSRTPRRCGSLSDV